MTEYLVKHKYHIDNTWYVVMAPTFDSIRKAQNYAKREFPLDEIQIVEI